jgi:hypothetical protein
VAQLSTLGIKHPMTNTVSKILSAVIAGLVIFQAGCSQPPTAAGRPLLSTDEALQLATKLANDQCEHQYKKRPFIAEQHPVALTNNMYRWGGLDVGGPGGFSALVTFRPDGSEPHVEVYFSDDALRPQKVGSVPPGVSPTIIPR